MSINEITDKVNELSSHWEEFKVLNDRRFKEVERKGAADPVTLNQIEKLNNIIDRYQENINRLEAIHSRPNSDFSSGELFSSSVREHKAAFNKYLRSGHDNELANLEKKALSVSSAQDGGFLVSRPLSDSMIKMIGEASPMRQIASIASISVDALELIEDMNKASIGWVHEADDRPITETPAIGKKIIPVHELYAQPKATQKLLDDASIDVENWLAEKLTDAFIAAENHAFINGDGKGKPKGILNYASKDKSEEGIKIIRSGEDGAVTAESVIRLFYSLNESYAVRSKFLMNRATIQAIRMLKDTSSGRYLWQPSFKDSTPDTILGAEVVQSADMPGLSEGSLAIALADFKSAYQIVDRQGISILRDPFTDKPYVKFYTTKRVGGDVINLNAIRLLQLSK